MSVFDLYNTGYKNILLSFQVSGEHWQCIKTRPFNDAEIDSIRSNCVMDNNPRKVVCLHIKSGGYIYIPTFNEQEELIRGNEIDLKCVSLVRLCHRNIGFDSMDDETIGMYIPINKIGLEIGSKIYLHGKAWVVAGKRPFNQYELDFVQSAFVSTDQPDKYVLFFLKSGKQSKIPLSHFGEDCPIGSSIDLKKSNLVTYYREGDGNVLRVEVNNTNNESSDINNNIEIKKSSTHDIETEEKSVEKKENIRYFFGKNRKILDLLDEIIWIILGILLIAIFIFNGCTF